MATTTNYAWETPDDTDLVKDGAAAIRTLGSSIDTTTKALNPSTTLGDIEYRSATANTNTRLPLGTAGQVLQVNSGATAPEWATPVSGTTFVGASVYRGAAQSISNATATALTFDNETFDTNTFHSNVTNNTRMTVPSGKAGKYLVTGVTYFTNNATGQRIVYIYKNGSNVIGTIQQGISGSIDCVVQTSFVLDLAVNDYVELYAYQNSGGSLNVFGNSSSSGFQVSYLGA